jgi:hypothetical protein
MRRIVKSIIGIIMIIMIAPILAVNAQETGPSQAKPLQALTEVTFFSREPFTRVLLKELSANLDMNLVYEGGQPTEIARRVIMLDALSGEKVLVLIEAATGDLIHTTPLDENGDPENPMWLCLDATGTIIRQAGKPVLVEPFNEKNDFFGRGEPKAQYDKKRYQGKSGILEQRIFQCINCSSETGVEDCYFIWW